MLNLLSGSLLTPNADPLKSDVGQGGRLETDEFRHFRF